MDNNKIKVLLIEDNPGDARLIREYLDEAKEAAFHVEHVDCLSKGLSCIAQGGIDAILLDLSLPDSQGLDGLGKILAQTLAVPIVVLSGLKDEAVAIKAVQQGAQDYLVKGNIDSSLLVRSLQYAIERQRLRVALRESENSYRLLADNIADVIWKADLKGRINYVSPSIKNFLGYTVGEAVKLEMKDILTPDSAEQAKRLIRDQIALWNPWAQHAPLSLTLEHIRKDGSTLWSDVRLSFLCNEKGNITGILGVTRDVTDRKKAEEAISESETQYRSLVETASKAGLGITIVQNIKDKEAVFVFVNDEYCKISGYSREELLGRSSLDTIPPENLASIKERYERRQKGESRPSYYEASLLRKDGTRLPIETSVSVFTYRGKPATVSFFRDITERRKTEEALRKSEERYRLLADNAVDIIWTIDMKGRINYVSPSAKNLFGYSVDEIMTMQMREFLTPASAEIARKVINEEIRMKTAVSQNSYCSLLLEHVRKDGSTFWTEVILSFLRDEHGRITLIQGVTRDITERRKAEEALRESEERYRLLAENVKDIIWTRDMNLKLTYTSPSVSDISGYSVEEVMSMSLEESLTPASIETLRPILNRVLAAKQKGQVDLPETVVLELDLVHKDGSVVPVEMKVNLMYDSEGRPLGFLGVTRDITERKKAENTLRQSEERFRAVFEGTGIGIALVGFDQKVLSINPAFEHMLGYGFEEFSKLTNLEYLHPDDAMLDAKLYIEMLKGKREHYTVDKRYIRKDRAIIWGRQNLSVVRDARGKPRYFIAMVEDITERKKADEALRESEHRLKDAMALGNSGYWEFDVDMRKLIWSDQTFRLFERDPSLGAPSFEEEAAYYSPEQVVKLREYGQRAIETRESIEYDFVVTLPSGKSAYMLGFMRPVSDASGKVVKLFGVFHDITERKRMEEELRRLSDAVRMSTDSIAITDLEGNVLDVNEAALKLQGTDNKADLLGLGMTDSIVPEDQERALKDLAEVMDKGYVSGVEYHILTRDGRKILVETNVSIMKARNGEPIGLVAIIRDITERKRIEDALRQSEENLRMITDNAQDLIAQLDAELVYRYVSPSYRTMLGYEVEEILGKNAIQVNLGGIHPDDLEATSLAINQSLSTLEPSRIQYRVKHADGHYLWLESQWSYLLGKNREIQGVVILSRDITERKKMEEALKQSEYDYRTLFDSIIDGMFVIDGETMKIVLGNEAAAKMYGYTTVKEGLGVNPLDFLYPEDRESATKIIVEDMFEKNLHQIHEFRTKTKDGKENWISIVGTKIEYQGKVAGLVSFRDITEQKRAEEEVRLLSDAVRMSTESMFIASIDGKVVDANEAALKMFDAIDRSDLIGRGVLDLIAPEDHGKAFENIKKAIEEGQVKPEEYHVVKKDGSRFLLEASASALKGGDGKLTGFVVMARDITERKQIEEALRQSEQSYRVLLESTHDSIIVVDAETFKVTFGNRRSALMFGFDPVLQDGVGVNLLDFIHPEDREIAMKGFMEDLYQADRRRRYDVRAKTHDGREIWVSALGTRIEFQGRVAVLLSLQDVTKDKQMDEEKRRLEEQIQLAGRLAAVGELAAGVAHELNNPIAAIQGFAQLLKGRKDLDTTVNRDLETIYKESQRAGKITQNLLTFARKHEPETSFISLNEALEKTLELHAHQMKVSNIELVVDLAPDLPKTMADFHQMQQVFMNIINNAEQAMVEAHGNGRFVVQTRRVARMIQVTFTDDGPGISEENLEKVFDPFFTTKEVGKGTGLGLSICYGLIQAHGGRIYAKSKLGEGTTFVVEIPIVSEKRPTSAGDLLAQDSRGVKWKKPKGQY